MNRARRKIRDLTDRRLVGADLDEIVRLLNPSLRGWGNYFCWRNSAKKFSDLDRYVYDRLVILMGKKHHIRGKSRYKRFNDAWLQHLGVYKPSGRVRYRIAYEPPWVRWRLGLLDSNRLLAGVLGSVGRLVLGGWDVVAVAV